MKNKVKSNELFLSSNLLGPKRRILGIKEIFKLVFKNYFFIIFSFINLFLPFYATIISALNSPNGALNVIGVGLSTSFITVFNQLLFYVSIALTFIAKKEKNDKNIFTHSSIYTSILIVTIISIGLFLLTSWLYITYSGIYQNIKVSTENGFNYVLSTAPSLLFNAFIFYNILHVYENKKSDALITLLIFFFLNIFFLPLCYLFIPWNSHDSTIGLGIGFLISSIVTFCISLLINQTNSENIYDNLKFRWCVFKECIKKVTSFAFNFLMGTFLKAILILGIALSLGLAQKDTPPAMMISKIIWYNNLFFCGFFADGLVYAVEYTKLQNIDKQKSYALSFEFWKWYIVLGVFGNLLTCIIFNFSAQPLSYLYVSHQNILIENPIPNWPALNGQEVYNYLWSPQGTPNIKLPIIQNNSVIGFQDSSSFTLLYTTAYHFFLGAVKIMSIKAIKSKNSFSIKRIISDIIGNSLVMVFVVVFSVVPNDRTFFNIFPALDGFSFSITLAVIILCIFSFIGFVKQEKLSKQLKY